jgi:hypothetical protein
MTLLKKIILIIFFFPITVFSQDFKAGAVGGVVFSQVDGDNYGGYNKLGVTGGLYVARSFSDVWQGQFEIVYKQKGSRYMGKKLIDETTRYYLDLNYIEIPLLVQLKAQPFSFEAGVAFGTLIRSSERDALGDISEIFPDLYIPFEDYEWSSFTGVNYHFFDNMYANIRWAYSINRVRKAYGGKYDDQVLPYWGQGKLGQYNHYISLSIYYEFNNFFSSRY